MMLAHYSASYGLFARQRNGSHNLVRPLATHQLTIQNEDHIPRAGILTVVRMIEVAQVAARFYFYVPSTTSDGVKQAGGLPGHSRASRTGRKS
jgi:hypothetical protein